MSETTDEITLDIQELVRANNQFAVDLYSSIASGEERDLFFSPSSISLALAMTYAGAGGATGDEIAEAMHFSLPANRFHDSMRAVQEGTKTGGMEFQIANRLWDNGTITSCLNFWRLRNDITGRHWRKQISSIAPKR